MGSSLPFALRLAAGLLAEALGAVRRLPSDLSTLPVTVVGQVAKLSFQLNQQLAELATHGDHLLAALHRPEDPPERTAWSTIDDEDEVAARDPQAAATWDSVEDAVSAVAGADSPERALVEDLEQLEGDRPPITLVGLPSPATPAGNGSLGSLTLAQLRSRVRSMPVEQVRAALEQEQSDRARPAFLTILTNRLSVLARGTD